MTTTETTSETEISDAKENDNTGGTVNLNFNDNVWSKIMKAVIEIELGNDAFGNNDAERLFEMRNVLDRLMDNAQRIMAADVGDMATAQDFNGNTVARMDIVEDDLVITQGDKKLKEMLEE